MFKNYLKITFRTLSRNKLFTSINILGLTVSLTICLLIIKIIVSIYSSDDFHSDRHEMYRVTTKMTKPPFENNLFATSAGVLREELNSMVGINDVVRFWNKFYDHGKVGEFAIPVNGYFADSNFFEFFDFELKYGNPKTVLNEPYSIVLTEETSKKLFNEENPVGKIIQFKDYGDFQVTGVIKDNNYKTHMSFGVIANGSSMRFIEKLSYMEAGFNSWENINTYTYIKIDKAVLPDMITSKLNTLLESNKKSENKISFHLQEFTKISPGIPLTNSLGSIDGPPVLLMFVAVLVIFTAGFTYNNLSIAKSFSRAKEVGIRKINGARSSQLFIQFISEAVVLALISLLLSYLILDMITPIIRSLDPGIAFYVKETSSPLIYILFFLFTVLLGLITGAFPAWYMSKFQAATILKGVESSGKHSRFSFKKAIIVFQFFLSLMLLFSIIVLYKQSNYEKKVDLGFDTHNVINVNLEELDFQLFKNKISEHNGVSDISASSFNPALGAGQGAPLTFMQHNDSPDSMLISFMIQSPNYLNNLGINLLAGRGFEDLSIGSDYGVLINKNLSEFLSYQHPRDAIGQTIKFDSHGDRTIIGVTDDFVVEEIVFGAIPLIINTHSDSYKFANIRLKPNCNPEDFIIYLEKEWKKLEPFYPLNYSYYTDAIDAVNTDSGNMAKFLTIITSLIILISVLGLLGIVMYDAKSRIKEIGLRKVMGASVTQVIWTLSNGYLIMILVAAALATPLSWLINDKFLQSFQNRVELNPLWYAMGIFLLLFIGAITTISQTIKAANSNPIDTLRHE